MNFSSCNIKCVRFGKHRNGLQRFRCSQCRKTFTESHERLFAPMIVPEDKALLAIQLLIEGTSVRTVERITQLHRDTILRLLVLAGERCIALMDSQMRNLRCEHIQRRNLDLHREETAPRKKLTTHQRSVMLGCSLRL